jgi:hypothetical protein
VKCLVLVLGLELGPYECQQVKIIDKTWQILFIDELNSLFEFGTEIGQRKSTQISGLIS